MKNIKYEHFCLPVEEEEAVLKATVVVVGTSVVGIGSVSVVKIVVVFGENFGIEWSTTPDL